MSEQDRIRPDGGSIGGDICKRQSELATKRTAIEPIWRDIADFCLPTASRSMSRSGMAPNFDRVADIPSPITSSRRRFDSTALTAIDRLGAGMESLVTPQSEKWHGLDLDDIMGETQDDQEKWFELVRDKLFACRYEPKAGFITANQKAIRSCIAFGTGVVLVEESFGVQNLDQRVLPFMYRHIPLSECFIDINAQGIVDTLYRRFGLTARQAVQRFGDKVSSKIREMAGNSKSCDRVYMFIHAVQPREEIGSAGAPNRKAPYASYYVEEEGRHLIGDGGFFEFPYAVYQWLPADESPYAESPAMLALDEIRGLNVTAKGYLRAVSQWVDPPIAISHDGVMNRPNMNAGKVNMGAIDNQGRLKIQPIYTVQNPAVVADMVEQGRNTVRSLFYNDLFQILIQNPQMTATEAMLRANEKGELLGPAGAKLQEALSHMIEREFGILARKGAFEPGSSLEAPDSLQGRRFSPRFTSPLDRLRQSKEGAGIMTAYQAASQIAQVKGDPSVFDLFDDDKALAVIADVNGAPASIMRSKEDVEAIRQQRAQNMQQAQQAAQAEQGAKAAKDGAAAAVDGTQAAGDMAQLQSLLGGGGANVAPVQLPQLAPGLADQAA